MISLEKYKAGEIRQRTSYNYFMSNIVNPTRYWIGFKINKLLQRALFELGKLNCFARMMPMKKEKVVVRYFCFIILSALWVGCSGKKEDFDSTRLEKQILCDNLEDPMEIAVAEDGKVFIIERSGIVKLFEPSKKRTKKIGSVSVNLGHEDGLLGLALHPDFKTNAWIFLLYTPNPHHVQRVSRFTFDGEKINMNSEKIILEYSIVPERHQGGSLLFDGEGNLFITTGENTIPTEINGYAPMDERIGNERSDAQRSAGNSNDLRGKILRIHPENNGSYTIPKGNFKEKYNLEKARPEIYIMGCRNPFRAIFDPISKSLYWGEIGPDAGADSPKGPKGHDEINRATEAGFYGWPYFIGNSKPYTKVNFETGEIGAKFNTEKPENNSPNNTGDRFLPKPKDALIWYPYDESKEFPVLGKGGRSAMAGMVYHRALHQSNEKMLPSYFENKLFIMDWMRNWIMTVSFDSAANLKNIEPFMPQAKFNRPMDMCLGNDGCLYLLEYGTNWFGNKNGTLSRIGYNRNNRAPKLQISTGDTLAGIPYTFKIKTQALDPDGDSVKISYFIDNEAIKANNKEFEYNFSLAGTYLVKIRAEDDNGAFAEKNIKLNLGNAPPQIAISVAPNSTFYNLNLLQTDFYASVNDKEDGNNLTPVKSLSPVHASQINPNLITGTFYERGKKILESSDCKSCHAANDKSVGPSFVQISQKYAANDENLKYLVSKVKNGGSGVWGNSPMSAHPQLTENEISMILNYIFSFKNVLSNAPKEMDENTFIKLKAQYLDKGNAGQQSIAKADSILLRNPKIDALSYNFSGDIIESGSFARMPFPDSYIGFNNIDLSQIKSIEFTYGYDFYAPNCLLECRLDGPNGKLIGSAEIKNLHKLSLGTLTIDILPQIGKKNVYFVYKPALDLHAPLNLQKLHFKFIN